MDSIWRDLVYAARTLRRSPAFTAVAILSLAVGIGASTAIFGLVDAAMLRPLPVESPSELVVLGWRRQAGTEMPDVGIHGWFLRDDNGDGLSSSYALPAFRAIRAGNHVLDDAYAFSPLDELNVKVGDSAELVDGQVVSGNYYRVLGLAPARGRLIDEGDDSAAADAVVVLSYGYWQRRFGGAGDVVGSVIRVNDSPFTVIGVAAEGFRGTGQVGGDPDLTIPLAMRGRLDPESAERLPSPDYWWLHVMGRLNPGVEMAPAQADLNLVFHRAVEADLFPDGVPEGITVPNVDLQPGARGMNERRRTLETRLATMSIVVALVLIIACVNVANLLLGRAATRRREIAVRLSMGASRWHLVRQLLAESVLLSLLAGLAGLLLATWGRGVLIGSFVSPDLYVGFDAADMATNARIVGFGILLSLATGVLFGSVPAWRSSRPDLTPALKQAGGEGRGGGASRWLPKGLLVAQAAMSVPLLVAAGLFVRTLVNLEGQATGFDAEGVALLSVDPSLNGYDGAHQVALYEEIERRLSAIPGVTKATVTDHSPLSNRISITTLKVPGYTPAEDEERPIAYYNMIGPEFFETFGIPVLLGRGITAEDGEGGRMVVVINQALAERYFPDESPLGKRLGLGRNGDPEEYEIVGVAGNVKYQRPHDPWYPVAHVAYAQHAGGLRAMMVAWRATGDLSATMPTAREVVRGVDANVPVRDVRTLAAQAAETVQEELLFVRLSSFLGGLALALACIGLYGILSYSVARRTREIGVRMALGARAPDIVRLVMAEMWALLIGAAIGAFAAYEVVGLLDSLLYGLAATDPATLAAATATMLVVAAAAAWLPARRAARVDPLVALRFD